MGQGPRIRVLLADGSAIARDTLAEIVSSEEDLELVATAADAHDTVLHAARHRPDVLLIDVRLPGGAWNAARAVAEASTGTRIIALSTVLDAASAERPARFQAAELLGKADARAILAAIRRAGPADATRD